MADRNEKPRVLIVDDDDEFSGDLKVLLSSEFDVSTALGSRQAHEMLVARPYDCMLLDLHMPQHFGHDPAREGLSFLNHLKSCACGRPAAPVPVIILTAFADVFPADVEKRYPVATLYRKPPDINRLSAAIWHLVRESRAS